MKKLYKAEFVSMGRHRTFYLTASQFCQIGKKIEEIEKVHITWKFEKLTYVGPSVMDEVLEIYEND